MKTTLVLLPGLNGTTGLFDSLIELNEGVFEILAISYPTEKEKSYSELTKIVLKALESVKGRFILVGESFSGPVALFVSSAKPVGMVGVVLVATFIRPPNLRIGRFLPWRIGFSLTKPLYSLRLAFSKNTNKTLIAKISVEMQKVSPRVLAARIKDIFSVDASEALIKCPVPVAYFRGRKDFVVPKKNLKEILSARPDVIVVEFDEQHFLLQSEPGIALSELKTLEHRWVER